MPTYEYRCKDCGDELEAVQGFHDDPLTECPTCGGPLRKKFGSVGISFKGSGFYKNDSRPSSGVQDLEHQRIGLVRFELVGQAVVRRSSTRPRPTRAPRTRAPRTRATDRARAIRGRRPRPPPPPDAASRQHFPRTQPEGKGAPMRPWLLRRRAVDAGRDRGRVVPGRRHRRGRHRGPGQPDLADAYGVRRTVVVAAHDLTVGESIEDDDLRSSELPVALVVGTPVADPTGRTVVATVLAGEPVVAERLAPDGVTGPMALAPADTRALAVPTPSGRPPVSPGDRVDIVAVALDGTTTDPASRDRRGRASRPPTTASRWPSIPTSSPAPLAPRSRARPCSRWPATADPVAGCLRCLLVRATEGQRR